LRGHRIGGAEVSTKHANFIIAHEGATAGDVVALIHHIQRVVFDRSGVALRREVVVWGSQEAGS
jgi:UDP-N-acetylmuramate dehydrogenase